MGVNRIVVGGYPIDGVLSEGDWLWFTGQKWTPIPYGTEGAIVGLINPPFPNVPFVSNIYIVSVDHPSPGDVLCAVRTLTTDQRKSFEYVTNIPFTAIDNRLRASDISTSYYTENSADSPTQPTKSLSSSSMGQSYSLSIT